MPTFYKDLEKGGGFRPPMYCCANSTRRRINFSAEKVTKKTTIACCVGHPKHCLLAQRLIPCNTIINIMRPLGLISYTIYYWYTVADFLEIQGGTPIENGGVETISSKPFHSRVARRLHCLRCQENRVGNSSACLRGGLLFCVWYGTFSVTNRKTRSWTIRVKRVRWLVLVLLRAGPISRQLIRPRSSVFWSLCPSPKIVKSSTRLTDHDLDHLYPNLPLWGAVQDLYSIYLTQETPARSCRLYDSHPATWARSYR